MTICQYDGGMAEVKNQGIILKAIPYQDNHHILSVFTEERGVIRLFVRGTQRARRASHALCTPLVLAEFIYRPKSSGLSSLHEGHVIDPFSELRTDYTRLEVAGQMVRRLSDTLWPEKPTPQLFALFLHYLRALKTCAYPKTLWASFLCKLYKHEGIWLAPISCSVCKGGLEGVGVKGGEVFCLPCFPGGKIQFNKQEKEWLILLTKGRKLQEMEGVLPIGFQEKLEELFGEL